MFNGLLPASFRRLQRHFHPHIFLRPIFRNINCGFSMIDWVWWVKKESSPSALASIGNKSCSPNLNLSLI